MPRTISSTSRRAAALCAERKPKSISEYFCRLHARSLAFADVYLCNRGRSKHSWCLGRKLHTIFAPKSLLLFAEEAHGIIVAIFVLREQTGQINTDSQYNLINIVLMLFWPLCIESVKQKGKSANANFAYG